MVERTVVRASINAAELARITGRDRRSIAKLCESESALGARWVLGQWCISIRRAARFFGLEEDEIRDALPRR